MEDEDQTEGQPDENVSAKKLSLAEYAALVENFERKVDGFIEREPNGRYAKGTPSPNPDGARRKERRMYGMSQTTKDLLELLDQPVTIKKGKKTKEVPAILAIYDRMIHMAVAGNWQAMRKCIELRERYSDRREQTLGTLLAEATRLRNAYHGREAEMPDELRTFVEFIELNVMHGQYRAG